MSSTPKGKGYLKRFGEVVGDGHALFQGFSAARSTRHPSRSISSAIRPWDAPRAHKTVREIGVVLIVVVNLDDVADLATEGRSSKLPKTSTNDAHW